MERETDTKPILLGIASIGHSRNGLISLLNAGPWAYLPLYPQKPSNHVLLLALRRGQLGEGFRISVLSLVDTEQCGWIDVNVQASGVAGEEIASNPGTIISDPVEFRDDVPLRGIKFWGCRDSSHALVALPLPPILLSRPGEVRVQWEQAGNSADLGRLTFGFYSEAELSEEERRAISAQPGSPRIYKWQFECSHCHDKIVYFASLWPRDRPQEITQDIVYIDDMPDMWTCKCSRTCLDTSWSKKAVPFLFRNHAVARREAINVSTLFHAPAPLVVARALGERLDRAEREEDLQRFLQENHLAWHFLSPLKIIHKPRILTTAVADFGIVTTNRTLYLVEIEPADAVIQKRSGGQHSDVQKAIDQIAVWREKISNHRSAVLEGINLKSEDIRHIRYLIVAGRGKDAGATIRSSLREDTDFLTYDELAGRLLSLHAQLLKT